MGSAIWTTKDGRRIAVSEMADGHLQNAFRFVRRAKARAVAEGDAAISYSGNGDEATASAEAAAVASFDKVALCNTWLNVFALELAKRSLEKHDLARGRA